ncbi:hypothetical protein OOK58_58980 [Streptomyces sp. NBC_01728]|uniref:hypothetical protein n=1 Tax=unclassified Streptomyces TaxID=2593676 RepID=UPI002256CA7C|nr:MULTISPECIES: hypothetical protein [unclassified Streptomyces]MCX4462394.1 hypothetical protein [Streptomyces sp. NBC_01719]MCX4500824.1 hypothetical protein [Streptomyces sp. NBC_01728]
MPANPRIPDPQEGALQAFAYDLRELGEGKVSVPWIADHEDTFVSRAALYAALSGTRLPTRDTVSTLLRWWAGNPADEVPNPDDLYDETTWGWIESLPRHQERRRLAEEWHARYLRLEREIRRQRDPRPKADSVVIALPEEQQLFIAELNRLIEATGLKDELWLLFGSNTSRIERYLAGQAIPTRRMCWALQNQLKPFLPEDLALPGGTHRLWSSAEIARAGRVRDRRIARQNRTSS